MNKKIKVPSLYVSRIAAGFPSPADDFIDKELDLNDYLIHHPAATFFIRVEGDSMIGAGIHSGDMLIVDRSMEAQNHCIIVAVINGEMTVKRLCRYRKKMVLQPENDQYPSLEITPEMGFLVWGVVTYVIHKL